MTRKFTRNTSALRGIAPFIAVLTVMIALAALAQVSDRGQRSAKSNVAAQAGDPSRIVQVPFVQWPDATAPANAAPPTSQPLFSTPRLFKLSGTYGSGGQYTSWVAMADLNGDGKPDLVTANYGTSTLGVLLGNGDGTFKTAVSYNSGGSFSVTVADVNRDGIPDLVVGGGVLLGNGDGTFQPLMVFNSGGNFGGRLAVADVNGDGKPDIVLPNSGTTVGVLLGNGDGTFQPATSYGSGGDAPGSIAVADVNGDRKPDIIVANKCPTSNNGYCPYGIVGVLLGNGDGTFQTAVSYPSGGSGGPSVSVGDVNGDGKPDLAVSNPCLRYNNCGHGTVGILLGNGDGTFKAVYTYSSGGNSAVDVTVADVNADNKADLLVADECGSCAISGMGVLVGNGNGSFQPAVLYGTGGNRAASIAVGDVNGDGKPDAVAANLCTSSSDCATGSVGILLAVRAPTKTFVTTSGSPSFVTQPVTFTATVTSTYGAIPDGELVTFFDGTTTMGTGATASGVAKFTTSSLTAKTHAVKAAYAGDIHFNPSSWSIRQVVEKYPTTTSLTSSPNPSQFGQAVTFTAQVTSTGPAPTGTVKFLDGTTGIGSATLSGGMAKLTKSTLTVGTHPITTQYLGNTASSASTSSVVNQVVQ
jgi:Bacterial Ig-like domain (group 3)/FG-GAP-like repeat/FG-GAP repeat